MSATSSLTSFSIRAGFDALPNGDVLVAETDAPPKPEDRKGIRGWVMTRVMNAPVRAMPALIALRFCAIVMAAALRLPVRFLLKASTRPLV